MNSETPPQFGDGLEWLREIRRQIDDRCGHDLQKLGEYYRQHGSGYAPSTETKALSLNEARDEK